jgi:hypothetical protein
VRVPRRTAIAVAFVLLVLGGACGGGNDGSKPAGGSATEVLREVDEHLPDIRSADLDFAFEGSTAAAAAEGGGARPMLGFRMQGPFSLESEGDLPVARLEYTQLHGTASETTTFVSTGRAAFVRIGDDTFRLPEDRVQGLKMSDGGSGIDALRLSRWFVDPKVTTNGDVDVVTGRLRPDVAFADLAALASHLGVPDATDLATLAAQDRARLDGLIAASDVTLEAGHDDGLLRSLEATVELRADVDDPTREALGDLAGARIDLRLHLDDVNEPVEVEAPAGAKPLP